VSDDRVDMELCLSGIIRIMTNYRNGSRLWLLKDSELYVGESKCRAQLGGCREDKIDRRLDWNRRRPKVTRVREELW